MTRAARADLRAAARIARAQRREAALSLCLARIAAWRERPVPFAVALRTDRQIAGLCGVSRRTLTRWKQHRLDFREALAAEDARLNEWFEARWPRWNTEQTDNADQASEIAPLLDGPGPDGPAGGSAGKR